MPQRDPLDRCPIMQLLAEKPGIVYRCIAMHLLQRARFWRKTKKTGALTLIRRFGNSLTKLPGAILNSRRLAPKG